VEDPDLIEGMAPFVNRPSNLIGCPLVLAVVLEEDNAITQFDAGRCAQNLMLAAWDFGIASVPNYAKQPKELREQLSIPPDRTIATILSLGFPARRVDPGSRSRARWLESADRLPLDELVTCVSRSTR
jgi:nitroreductase